jgi:hypothetical protein
MHMLVQVPRNVRAHLVINVDVGILHGEDNAPSTLMQSCSEGSKLPRMADEVTHSRIAVRVVLYVSAQLEKLCCIISRYHDCLKSQIAATCRVRDLTPVQSFGCRLRNQSCYNLVIRYGKLKGRSNSLYMGGTSFFFFSFSTIAPFCNVSLIFE